MEDSSKKKTKTKHWFPSLSGIFSPSKDDDTASSSSVSSTASSSSSTHEESSSSSSSSKSASSSSITTDTDTTTASPAPSQQPKLSESLTQSIRAHNDPFDDNHSLTEDERIALLQRQKQQLASNNRSSSSRLEPVSRTVPAYIPPNFPATELATPETLITKLDNGVRVVSQETYGQVSTIGVVSELGSRHETAQNNNIGVTHLLELLAFGACSTDYPDAAAVATKLQDWGATRFVSAGREQSIHCIDILRPNVEQAVQLLSQVLLEPQFLPHEVDEAKQAILFQSLPDVTPPELLLQEALQSAAYGSDQQLGQPHFCSDEPSLALLTRQTALDYWKTQFLDNPQGLVIGGAGVDHDQLVRLCERHFGHLRQDDTHRVRTIPSKYRGGEASVALPLPPDLQPEATAASSSSATTPPVRPLTELSAAEKDKRLTRVAVALETGGWHSDDLVAACVLQTLLGGGSSFSAGGPGKGMYSRLYRQVLNQYSWAESAEAFTAFHGESGLFGIAGATQPDRARDMVQVLCQHLGRVAHKPVTDEELCRARNMLKCNVLTQLESRLVLFEDMARQVLTYNKRENIRETCQKIDAVTAEDVQRIAVTGLQKPPTLASVGMVDYLQNHVPRQSEVAAWLFRGE